MATQIDGGIAGLPKKPWHRQGLERNWLVASPECQLTDADYRFRNRQIHPAIPVNHIAEVGSGIAAGKTCPRISPPGSSAV